jgi:hypothetical protein
MGPAEDFKKFTDFFTVTLPRVGDKIKEFGDGLRDIFEGVGKEIDGVGAGINLGFKDVGLLIEYCFILLGSYLACGVYFITQLPKCMFYYVLEWIGQVLYLPVRIFVWVMKTFFKIKLQKYLDKFWRFMEKVDLIIYKHAKFHIIHYPRSVRERCYVCKRLKDQVITRQSNTVNYDFAPAPDGGIYKVITSEKYGGQLKRGVNEMNDAFTW